MACTHRLSNALRHAIDTLRRMFTPCQCRWAPMSGLPLIVVTYASSKVVPLLERLVATIHDFEPGQVCATHNTYANTHACTTHPHLRTHACIHACIERGMKTIDALAMLGNGDARQCVAACSVDGRWLSCTTSDCSQPSAQGSSAGSV